MIAVDWKTVKRWCLIGTFVMLGWLLLPVASCSIDAFRDTPLSEAQPHGTPAADADDEPGFFTKVGRATKVCYARTPLLGQETWKTYLLFGFAGAVVLAAALARWGTGYQR